MDFPADRLEIVVVDSGADESGAERVAQLERRPLFPVPGPWSRRCAKPRSALGVRRAPAVRRRRHRRGPSRTCASTRPFMRATTAASSPGTGSSSPSFAAGSSAPRSAAIASPMRTCTTSPTASCGDAERGQVHPRTLAAANLSIRAETFRSLGGFDERFPVGAEDQDLTWRAAKAGCLLVYDYDIRVIHNDQHSDLDVALPAPGARRHRHRLLRSQESGCSRLPNAHHERTGAPRRLGACCCCASCRVRS